MSPGTNDMATGGAVTVGRWRSVARAAVSLLLALCIGLPLSSCETTWVEDGREQQVTTNVSGIKVMERALDDIASRDLRSADGPLLVLNLFFAPLLYLRLKQLPRAFATIASAPFAAYATLLLVLIGTPEPGGYITAACWSWLLADSVWTVILGLRHRRHAALMSG